MAAEGRGEIKKIGGLASAEELATRTPVRERKVVERFLFQDSEKKQRNDEVPDNERHKDQDEDQDDSIPEEGVSQVCEPKNDEKEKDTQSNIISAEKQVQGSPSAKRKTAHAKKNSTSKSTKKVENVSLLSISKYKGKGISNKEVLTTESKESQNASSKEKSNSKKQGKFKAKASTKGQTGKRKALMARAQPSDQEMMAVVSDMLRAVDFDYTSLDDILKELEAYFYTDLSHIKDDLPSIIEEAIDNMTDAEEEEEDEEDDY